MNDDNDQKNNPTEGTVCPNCKKNPCVCPPKPRVKGSHRKGTPPKLKWI